MTPRFFASADTFHAWLDRNHDRATELLVGFHKKAKKEETRQKRLARLMDRSARSQRVDLMKPYA